MITTKFLATINNCKDPSGSGCTTVLPQVSADEDQLKNILAVFFGVTAAVAVLIILIAAINFASAGGDAEKVSRSKNTMAYALIGLLIAISAEAIVLTVLGRIGK